MNTSKVFETIIEEFMKSMQNIIEKMGEKR